MKTIKKYLGAYAHFFNTNVAKELSFRSHFVLLIIMDILFLSSSIATVSIIYNHIDTIGAWDKNQFLFFMCFILSVSQIHMVFISQNFWELSHDVKVGNLDFKLLKPIGTLFLIYFRHMRIGSIPGLFLIHGALIYYGQFIDLSIWDWVMMPFFLLASLTLKISLEMLMSLGSLWMVESFGLNFLRMQFQQLSRWPDYIYKAKMRMAFSYFLPFLLIGSAPVRFLFNSKDYKLLLVSLVVLAVSWVLIGQVWKLGVKQYESASS